MGNDSKYYLIDGGVRLRGKINIAGAKNALSKQLVASLLTKEPCTFTNVPQITEIYKVLEMLEGIGSRYEWLDKHTLTIQTPKILNTKIDPKFQHYNRIPILLLGPLLHRMGNATVPIPGGCKIGSRSVDFHITALELMGAKIDSTSSDYFARGVLRGAAITLPYPSVGATENIILSAVLAKGKTAIHNAAIEPEIFDTIFMLRKMGAGIEYLGGRLIVINGIDRLWGISHHTICDRIEAASFATLALATNGYITISGMEGTENKYLKTFLAAFCAAGGGVTVNDNLSINFFRKSDQINPLILTTDVHPGFMTDGQQPFAVMLTQAEGTSIIHETVYEKRFDYTQTLNRMGAKINLSKLCLVGEPCRFNGQGHLHSCIIEGPTQLHATDIKIPDLRAGFAHVIAALLADGKSMVHGVEHLERGYEDVAGKLKSIGASIEVFNP